MNLLLQSIGNFHVGTSARVGSSLYEGTSRLEALGWLVPGTGARGHLAVKE